MKRIIISFMLLMCCNLICIPAKVFGQADQPLSEVSDNNKPSSNETEAPMKILSLGLNMSQTDTLDPHFASESRERVISEMIFNRLIRYKPGSATEFEPDLAENIPEPESIYGRQVWKFTLRKGIMFHPGPETESYELTADDVIYSLRKSVETASQYAGDYSGMTVEKTGDYEVRVILEKPMSPPLFKVRLAAYAGGFIISKKAYESMEKERLKIHPVGTGPFMIDNYIPGEKIRLKAYKKYFRGRPLLDGVDIYFMRDIKDREAGLTSGKLDIIEGMPDTEWVEKTERIPDVSVDLMGIGEVSMLHFNMKKALEKKYSDESGKEALNNGKEEALNNDKKQSVKENNGNKEPLKQPLDDIRVRRAIAYALDRDSFMKKFGDRFIQNVFAPAPDGLVLGGLKKERALRFGLDYPKNLDKARDLMTQAGYQEGFSLELVTSKMPVYHKYYESLKEQLAAIGINCILKTVTHTVMHTKIRWDENALVVYITWRPDADAVLSRFFHSDAIVVTGSKKDINFSHYDKADPLIETARTETDPEKQSKLWGYAQIKILDHLAAYPLHYIRPVHARRSRVDYGHNPEPMALYPHITENTEILTVP